MGRVKGNVSYHAARVRRFQRRSYAEYTPHACVETGTSSLCLYFAIL